MFYILSHLNKTGEESCELLNLCSSSSLSNSKTGSVEHKWEISEQFTDLFRKIHHSIPSLPGHRTRKEVSKQNVIKIAHLTDIHVEEEYVEVNRTDVTKCILSSTSNIVPEFLWPQADFFAQGMFPLQETTAPKMYTIGIPF